MTAIVLLMAEEDGGASTMVARKVELEVVVDGFLGVGFRRWRPASSLAVWGCCGGSPMYGEEVAGVKLWSRRETSSDGDD